MRFFNYKKNCFTALAAFAIAAVVSLDSCVKDAPINTYPPEQGATCFDKIQNQNEYGIDCGGPCLPCVVGDPFVTVTIDSTWVVDSNKTEFRFWTPKYVYVDDTTDIDNLIIICVDSFENKKPFFISVSFKISKDLKRGVHMVDSLETYERYNSWPPTGGPGGVELENGIITITSKDESYGYMSGNFEFISKPVDFYTYRVALIDGEFRNIPLWH